MELFFFFVVEDVEEIKTNALQEKIIDDIVKLEMEKRWWFNML